MKAVRFIGVGKAPEITDVPAPQPGPGQVLIKIGGAGVCHSDLHIMEEELGFKPPFILGHENAGWIAKLGAGVTGLKEGDAVAVYGPWGCGHCHSCQLSMENYCENWASIPTFGGGLGSDGGMAEYMLVPSARLLVSLGNLSPDKAAPLSDAALTPYHAIKRAIPSLNADDTVVVIGVGGLGHMAVQLVRALSPVRVIAADIDESKLQQAKELGAEDVVNTKNGDEAAERIRAITGPRGAGLVLDCSGVQPYGTIMSIPYWGSRVELMEVIAMARDGRIHAETTNYPLEQAVDVYKKLKAGEIHGRAVLIPHAK
jgi:propanol-preferring alcohol dehydrogenase